MNRHVVLTTTAERDFRQISGWIRKQSARGASSWINEVELAINRLAHGSTGEQAAEAESFGTDLRQQLFKTRRGRTFRLLFLIREETVHILSIRGAGQDNVDPDDVEMPD